MVANVVLIADLVKGSKVTQSATSLLASGALIWLGNALIFGLLYWELDSGGPLARYRRERAHPDFAFSQQLNPSWPRRAGGRSTSTTSSSASRPAPRSARPT